MEELRAKLVSMNLEDVAAMDDETVMLTAESLSLHRPTEHTESVAAAAVSSRRPVIVQGLAAEEEPGSSEHTVGTVPFRPGARASPEPRDLSEVTNRRVKTATAAKDGGPSARDASSSDAAGSQPHRAIPEDPVFSPPMEVDTMDFKVRFAPGNSFSLRGRECRPIPPLGPQDHQQGCPSDLLSRLDFSNLEML